MQQGDLLRVSLLSYTASFLFLFFLFFPSLATLLSSSLISFIDPSFDFSSNRTNLRDDLRGKLRTRRFKGLFGRFSNLQSGPNWPRSRSVTRRRTRARWPPFSAP